MDHLKETPIDSKAIFQGNIITVSQDSVRLPNGKTASRDIIRHPGAACVLAVNHENKVVLVKQWRHAAGQALLEIPAGKLDHKGEDPKDCAFRELAEETPYTAKEMRLLHKFYTAPGFCDEILYLYLAQNLEENSTLILDEDEFVDTVLLSKDEVKRALNNQEVIDAKSIIALQAWLLLD